MLRHTLLTTTYAVVLSAFMLPTSRADELADPFADELVSPPPPAPAALETEATPVEAAPAEFNPFRQEAPAVARRPVLRQVGMQQATPLPQPIDASAHAMPPQGIPQQAGYVQLGAPLYPSPRPNIPIWTGSTMITNQAFAPHEMLYPHTYKATYPPFYHRVKGGWILTPFGVRSHERWELQGTQVQVKYRSSYPGLFKGAWHPPMTSGHSHFHH